MGLRVSQTRVPSPSLDAHGQQVLYWRYGNEIRLRDGDGSFIGLGGGVRMAACGVRG
jgi:hypothetical protein